MDKTKWLEDIKKLGININEKQLEKLDAFYNMLIEKWYNNVFNILDYLKGFIESFYRI